MASMVCFPFKKEIVETVLRNVKIAAEHDSVAVVLLVAAGKNETYLEVEQGLPEIEEATGKSIEIMVQKRLGAVRLGKGDGMNTAMQVFYDHESKLERLHFYDADIESFSGLWITKAEEAAELDYDIVRHYFPRSSTDAQITWQITRIGFSLLWPNSNLAHIQQPLGGELLMSRRAVKTFLKNKLVMDRSDWGIDTMYTFVAVQHGLSICEIYVPQGKLHALYDGLRDLKTMLIECFDAIQAVQNDKVTAHSIHHIHAGEAVPETVKTKIGYNIEKSIALLREDWTPKQEELLQLFPANVVQGLTAARDLPQWSFMDEEAWVESYKVLLEKFDKNDADWCELIFKLWVSRVLNYTMRHVMRGYDVALSELNAMVRDVQISAGMKELSQKRQVKRIAGKDVSGQPPSPTNSCMSLGSEEMMNSVHMGLEDTPTQQQMMERFRS